MRHSDRHILRLGAITLVLMALVMAAAFNLSRFPGFAGTTYEAEFTDASGIHIGNDVQIGGIRVGRVDGVDLDGTHVLVRFSVDNGVDVGDQSSASVEVLNLLGEKYLQVDPAGSGHLDPKTPIPLDRTTSAYDIVNVLGDLTTTTEQIDKPRLEKAFATLSQTVSSASPEIRKSFVGISRLSRTVASRDAEIRQLFVRSQSVSKLLASRSSDLVDLMGNATKVFEEVQKRRLAIHQLLVNARELADQLRGVATDNQHQIGQALSQVDGLLTTLNEKDKELKATLAALGPYVSILSNIIGTGPWFNAYASNLAGIATGEFVPGPEAP